MSSLASLRRALGDSRPDFDPTSERMVAVMVLLWGTMANRLERQRFLLEARAASVHHPAGSVSVLDTGGHEGCPYLTMEYVAGPSVRDVLEEQGPFPVQTALQMPASIATAVHCAHGRGIMHRDIKPANSLLQDGHFPRMIDFGVAGYECEDFGGLGTSVGGGRMPRHMSPEQAVATSAHTDPLSDVLSPGPLFFHMLTGHPPPPVRRRGLLSLPPGRLSSPDSSAATHPCLRGHFSCAAGPW